MITLLCQIFGSYIATAVIVNSAALYSFREWFKVRTPYLVKGCPQKHMIDCRMCTGFWISLAISATMLDIQYFPLIYGASYFLCTQER